MADDSRELIRRIAAVVGHELRNPLAVINNSAYFVRAKLGGAGLDPKVEKHLKIISSEIARADGLISDMTAFARPYEPMLETRALDALVKEAVAAYAAPDGGKVELKLGAKDAAVKVEPKAFEGCVKRLLDNAFDAQGGKGAVKAATGTGKDGVWLSVADSGPGVDAKVRDTLFDPFVTTKPRGLGLGLSLARKFIRTFDGEVAFESTAKGATFRVVLPKA